MKFDFDSITPGINTLPSGSFVLSNTAHSCEWRGLAASRESAAGFAASTTSTISASGTSQ